MPTVTTDNLILATDSYKVPHWLQYPPGMTYMFDYFESRGGKHRKVQFFGLQYVLKHYLSKRITAANVREADELFAAHFGTRRFFPLEGWMYVAEKLGGRLPLRIRAVPEGGVYPVHTALFTIESTDRQVPWIVSWIEGLAQKAWYPSTVATEDFHTKLRMWDRRTWTMDDPEAGFGFQLHDFGYRGTSSEESAKVGGGAALVNFLGSDTVPALKWLSDFYHEPMAGFSIAASEHSTMTTWGQENEAEAFRNMIQRFGNESIFACVSDQYDIYNAVDNLWGRLLLEDVQKMNATLVIRPDSGDPVEVVTRVLSIAESRFGTTTNSRGYKVLNKVRVIQGDGINHDGAILDILDAAIEAGFSAENLAFGMGGGRLQMMNRDTQKFAIKCSLAEVNGERREVYKDPVTDKGKRSMRGYIDTVVGGGLNPYSLDRLNGPTNESRMRTVFSLMRTVFENGEVLIDEDFATIRGRAQRDFDDYILPF